MFQSKPNFGQNTLAFESLFKSALYTINLTWWYEIYAWHDKIWVYRDTYLKMNEFGDRKMCLDKPKYYEP